MHHKQNCFDSNGNIQLYKYMYPCINGNEISTEIFFVCAKCHDSGDFSTSFDTLNQCKRHIDYNH